MSKKRGRGHKIGPCEEWTDQQQQRIVQHRKRIADEMRRIQKTGLDLHRTPVCEILEAGVELSNEMYLTPSALEKKAVETDKKPLESIQMNDRQKRILTCAVEYAKMGWAVLPVHTIVDDKCTCGKADCSSAGKHPATANGVKDASTDSDQLKKWFGNGRLLNIGIAAGADSKLAILDIDPKNGGDEAVKRYKIPKTLEVITGSGGRHYYFADPDGTVGNSVGKLGEGIDVRGNNGYVVAPPSLHASGKEYRWAIDPRAVEIAAFPKWMDGKQECRNVGIQECKADGPIAEGKRNETLCSVAGSMRRQGCDADVIFAALIDINQRRCKPPVEYAELQRIAQSVARYPAAQPPASQVPPDGVVLNDDHPETIAAAFHKAAANAYRFNPIDGWSILEDDRYRRADEGQVAVALRQWLNDVYVRKLIAREWTPVRYKKSNNKVRDIMTELGAMVEVYIPTDKHAPASLSGSLDTQHIIAANNCLLNIKTLPAKQEHLTEDFYTLNYLPFDYDPAATCPQWTAFLESVFTERQLSSKKTKYVTELDDFVEQYETIPDALAIEILGEWFGYLLSKETRLQKIFGLIGERRSGKSTIGRVLRALNGAANTASPTLNSLATEFGLQGLVNKTIAVIGDANAAGRSGDATRAVERLKSISGEDGQQINRKNKAFIEVEKLPVRFVLIANKMQDLRDSTGALASRFNILVTTQTFLGREDHHLIDRLMTELPGIFNWAMEGLARLRKRGFIEDHPAGIDARDEFEQMTSPMKAFIEDWCVVDESASVPVDILWMAHGKWADENGNNSYSKRKFIVEVKGACGGVKRTRLRIDSVDAQGTYKWDIGAGDNRISVLTGIDLAQGYKTAWASGTQWDSGTGNGTGYPYDH